MKDYSSSSSCAATGMARCNPDRRRITQRKTQRSVCTRSQFSSNREAGCPFLIEGVRNERITGIFIISLVAMTGGAAIGSWLRDRLPEHHLADRPASVIKSGMGLISTLAALILGLLISTAKISYDLTASQISQIASDLVLLNQLLSEYGPAASGAREALRNQSEALANSIWAGASNTAPRLCGVRCMEALLDCRESTSRFHRSATKSQEAARRSRKPCRPGTNTPVFGFRQHVTNAVFGTACFLADDHFCKLQHSWRDEPDREGVCTSVCLVIVGRPFPDFGIELSVWRATPAVAGSDLRSTGAIIKVKSHDHNAGS